MMTEQEKTTEERLQDIGRCAYECIVEMVEALQCDYGRLEELRDQRDDWEFDEDEPQFKTWSEWLPEEAEELAELEKAVGDCESEESARERIEEDPLTVMVRSGWHFPGEESEAEEFEILLGTGGPAVRIVGELDEHNQPFRATLQTQDWFTPWTDYLDADQDVLLAYCQVFYFGN